MNSYLWSIPLTLFGCFLSGIGAVALKKSMKNFKFKRILKNKKLIVGVFLYGLAIIIYLWALTGGDVSVLYPFAATTYLWVAFFSIKFLKEKMNKWRWLGLILIITGVALIGFGAT